jgi:diacylglycerol kinase (ATP)
MSDQFCALLEERLLHTGWVDTLWLETSAEDPGRAMAQQAVAENVDLVIGAGGDGTVRIVADGLAHTGTPTGLIPAGTANLLARISISRWRKGPRSRSPRRATPAPST